MTTKKRATSTKKRRKQPSLRDVLVKFPNLRLTQPPTATELRSLAELPAPTPTLTPPDQVQVGGRHYKVPDPSQQHWNLVVAFGWDYFTAQATKYLFRWPFKGNVEDLKKARHYLDKLIELVENGWVPSWGTSEAWRPPGSEPGKKYVDQD